ncbi:MAG: electron transfer flavoprotein subunit beta/FixA family protein [Bacteroidetes bacterium]|jgi:electron transfer flavoprotein beta subunit|nr:electron transfer flavoprotein subunit beta/FixA family protein [Bacteroidota bacterium]HQW45806.1 electron transfer flavoprotein subunit beta/FixA family protein [Chitinophagaceae bacterium]MBK6820466.1 electron transfer flavoprotein subunit beta/FixA family protein [Bacteroidota bacterium]MBK7041012.1 electron transfer flavoprotein subunit beta/FixA family protein [Bacteroidota bacterium]MBK7587825.1 electron transfer flavoprotein subunit beta/FixA family protein [Bacteroidota bacterium]
MKILVCITKAPDTTTKIAFSDNNTKLNDAGVQWIINPYDEWYALVRALELKEAGIASDIHLITVGKADTEPVIRKALALGGDEAIRIDADSNDSFYVASQIADYVKSNAYELILTGKESIDYNNASIGAMVAELLDLPYITHVCKLDIEAGVAHVNREIEGGEESNTCPLPLVISCQKGMSEARIPNMRGIMAARTKPLKVVPPSNADSLTEIIAYETPLQKQGVKMIDPDQMDELVRLLHEEAKVI